MIFHGERGRASGNKAVELRADKISEILTKASHITVLTIEKWYPYVPQSGDRKWFESLDPTTRKNREESDCIPAVLFSMTNLVELNFYDCIDSNQNTFFKRIPLGLNCLENLKKLTISHCGLEKLDYDTQTSHGFKSLDAISKSFFIKMKSLEILSVPANNLRHIPETIGFCTTLKSLRIYNNQLEELPSSILNLNNLRELICYGNKINKIPISLTKYCSNLQDLRILNQDVDIKKKISIIATDEKALSKIRDAEAKQPRDRPFTQVVEYLNKFLSNTPRIRLNRCKLMFVGDGAVGKTTTLGSLKNLVEKSKKSKQALLDNVATDGIDMHPIRIPAGFKYTQGHIGGSESINFSCWDFAGQDVYTYTHQFFLSDKAIYLIGFNVENAIRPDGDPLNMIRVDYWLQSISMRFPASPIIIFGTHIDGKATKEQLKALHKQLTEKYVKNKKLKVLKVVFLSNETGKGLKDLLDEIKSVCKGKKFAPVLGIEKEYDIRWVLLEERGKAIGGLRVMPIISFEEWLEIAKADVGLTNEDDVRKATQFLHDTGSLVWFNEEGLSDIVCLRPDFLAEVFAAVISAKTGLSSGILKHEFLLQIWKGFPLYLYPYMLALLEKFEITHRLEGSAINNTAISSSLLTDTVNDGVLLNMEDSQVDMEMFKGRSIIPSMLPEMPPPDGELKKSWPLLTDTDREVERVYQFDFIPNGFFSRLTIRLLHSQWNATVFWRYGIILNKDDSYLYLQYNVDAKEIRLVLRQSGYGNKLGQLLESMNALIADWLKNAEIHIHIPVRIPGGGVVNVDIKAIEKAASNGATYVKITDSYEVRLDEIAPDLTVIDDTALNENDVQTEAKIGEGGFAIVYKGSLSGTPVAIKRLIMNKDDEHRSSEIFSEFRREVWLMSTMRHPNIVALKGTLTKPSLSMVLEMMDGGDLFNYIQTKSNLLPVEEQIKLALDIAKGMQFMHSNKPPIIHRDLKSPNILLKKYPKDKFPTAKIADFGLSRGLNWSANLDDKAVDNPVWLAPEILKKKPYTGKVDVYAFGVILYELVSRLQLFGEISFMSKVEEKIVNGERPEIPDTLPELRHLIEKSWAQNPDDRPTFDQIVPQLEALYKKYDGSYKSSSIAPVSDANAGGWKKGSIQV